MSSSPTSSCRPRWPTIRSCRSSTAASRGLKAEALTALAERQVNAIARHYYLTSAQFLLEDLPPR